MIGVNKGFDSDGKGKNEDKEWNAKISNMTLQTDSPRIPDRIDLPGKSDKLAETILIEDRWVAYSKLPLFESNTIEILVESVERTAKSKLCVNLIMHTLLEKVLYDLDIAVGGILLFFLSADLTAILHRVNPANGSWTVLGRVHDSRQPLLYR